MQRNEALQAVRRLPWFEDLTEEQQEQMLNEVLQKPDEATREEFTELLLAWSSVAHISAKQKRLAMLIESNLLGNASDDEDLKT